MPQLIIIHPDGTRQPIQATPGQSVMQAARDAGIDGIVADCGGEMACATCHVFVRSHLERLPLPGNIEDEMLDFTTIPREENSRLSCQLKVRDELEGLEIELPEAQI